MESLGQILVDQTELTPEQLDLALRMQQTQRPRASLGQILCEQGYCTEEQLCRALAAQWDIPYFEKISADQLKPQWVRNLPLGFLKKQCVLPIADDEGEPVIAMANPLNVEAYDAVLNVLDRYCRRVLSSAGEIEKAISRCYYHDAPDETDSETVETISEAQEDSDITLNRQEDLLNIANQPPIVKLVNTILFQAVNRRASDIHIEPYEEEVIIRYRIDGVLQDVLTPPKRQLAALISRLKIMANLNIAERRLPQDGQCQVKIGQRELDIRVSIIPTSGGERLVLRLLDRGGPGLTMAQLGFAQATQQQFLDVIHNPHGIFLITGPTGSGKTTTLYCVINELNNHERNILTVEDPIEYQLPGVGQTQVNPKINLTFANSLRHILRQDPDVIMIGEIRDRETAEIAVHASLTGHLVLSTLHTNDSASAITRLIDMHVEPYLVSSSLQAVMAQRLVRVICPECKTACRIETDATQLLQVEHHPLPSDTQFYTGAGCEHCLQTGYFGRTGIFELLTVAPAVRELIVKQAAAYQIKEAAVAQGMTTLRDDGLRKAYEGITSVEEILRVTQESGSCREKDYSNVEV
jgi:general secretion pathway protein E